MVWFISTENDHETYILEDRAWNDWGKKEEAESGRPNLKKWDLGFPGKAKPGKCLNVSQKGSKRPKRLNQIFGTVFNEKYY